MNELSLASPINEASATSMSLKFALNIRMLLYFSDHQSRLERINTKGILTPKLKRSAM